MLLIDKPVTQAFNAEGPTSGLIGFSGGQNAGASFTVNGVAVPKDGSDFNLAKATIPNAVPGGTLTVVATRDGKSASIVAPCPTEVVLSTDPPEGSTVGAGDTITVSWVGKLDYVSDLFMPIVDVYRYDPASGRHVSILGINTIHPKLTDTRVSVVLPDNIDTHYDIELSVPGDHVRTAPGEANCILARRVRLIKR